MTNHETRVEGDTRFFREVVASQEVTQPKHPISQTTFRETLAQGSQVLLKASFAAGFGAHTNTKTGNQLMMRRNHTFELDALERGA